MAVPPDAGSVEIKIAAVVPTLYFHVRVDAHGLVVASVKGHPGCVGDGTTKEEALRNATSLYLHMLIMRMQRGSWTPQILKHDEEDP